jgi:predicted ferric reductase
VIALWLAGDGLRDIHDAGSLLTGLGRVTGLLGAYLALVGLVLIARVPVLDRLAGFDRLTGWHGFVGRWCVTLLVAHTLLITAGYTVGDGVTLWREIGRLISGYPGVITATAGLVLLIAVGVSSAAFARRRLRYETWYFVHLYAYLAVALAFSHQLATGSEFVGRPLARAYWYALYGVTLAALLVFRLGVPVWRSLRHRLRVERVAAVAPDVTTLEIGGVGLERLGVRAGQFFTWRFLTRDRWWEAHPFSLSAAPDGRRLRITVKDLGDFTARLRAIPEGTRVIAEGPFGLFTAAARRRERVALIAGGAGITAIRALLEDLDGDVVVVYRALREDDVILRDELDALGDVHYLVGEPLSHERLHALVPDIAERDVYVCGSPAMTDTTRVMLVRLGVPRRHIFTERFGY